MAIVEALKKFGVSLLGENYTPTEAKTDSQIAETIEGISKAIDDAGGIGGGGSGIEITTHWPDEIGDPVTFDPLEPGLTVRDLINATVVEDTKLPGDVIVSANNIYPQRGTPLDIGSALRVPEVGESVTVSFSASGSTSNYDAIVTEGTNGRVTISFVHGLISIAQDGSATYTAGTVSGQQSVSVYGSELISSTTIHKIVRVVSRDSLIGCFYTDDFGDQVAIVYHPQTGEVTTG